LKTLKSCFRCLATPTAPHPSRIVFGKGLSSARGQKGCGFAGHSGGLGLWSLGWLGVSAKDLPPPSTGNFCCLSSSSAPILTQGNVLCRLCVCSCGGLCACCQNIVSSCHINFACSRLCVCVFVLRLGQREFAFKQF